MRASDLAIPMDPLERCQEFDQLLQERRIVPRSVFLEALEISPATFERDLVYKRDRFNASVVWNADAGG